MNKKQRKIQKLKEWFLNSLAEDPQDGTTFDSCILNTLEILQKQFADNFAEGYITINNCFFPITDEMRELGFVLKEDSGIAGCNTIPCFGGKMPYDCGDESIACAIGRTMCSRSPVESIRESNKFKQQIKHREEAKRIREILINLGDTFEHNGIVKTILRQRIEQEEFRAEGISE